MTDIGIFLLQHSDRISTVMILISIVAVLAYLLRDKTTIETSLQRITTAMETGNEINDRQVGMLQEWVDQSSQVEKRLEEHTKALEEHTKAIQLLRAECTNCRNG